MIKNNISFVLHTNDKIIENLKKNPKVIKKLESFDIYQIVLLSQNNKNFNEYLNDNKEILLEKLCTNYNFFDGLSLLILMKNDYFKNDAKKIYESTMKQIFNPKTLIFMTHINNEVISNSSYNKQQIFSQIFKE